LTTSTYGNHNKITAIAYKGTRTIEKENAITITINHIVDRTLCPDVIFTANFGRINLNESTTTSGFNLLLQRRVFLSYKKSNKKS